MSVTAFITTIGSPLLERCIASVKGQCAFELIENVAPMAAAKQRMVELCRTRFFVLVSEDMALYPRAIATLTAAILETPNDVATVAAPLWDLDIEQPIYGLKIWRRSIVRRVPFVSHPDGDVHDRVRLHAAGYQTVKMPRDREHCLGDHGPCLTAGDAFTRWRRLWQRHRRTGAQAWIEEWLPRLYERSGRSRIDLFAFLGAVTGASEPPWPEDFDPYDFRHTDEVLERLVALLPPVGA